MDENNSGQYSDKTAVAIIFIIGISVVLFLIFIFPVYLRAFIENRKRDREAALFPIFSHFYKSILLIYIILFFSFSIILITAFLRLVLYYIPAILLFFVPVIVHVQQLLLSLLAIHQLFSAIGIKNRIFTEKLIGKSRFILYPLITITLFYLTHEEVMNWRLKGSTDCLNYYLISCLGFVFSAFLNIPVLLISKLRKSSKVPQNPLERSLSCHSIMICLYKLPHILYIWYLKNRRIRSEEIRETAVYPIINHFYKTLCLFYAVLFTLFLVVVIILFLGSGKKLLSISIHFATMIFVMFPMIIFVQVHHLIIFLLSLQRLILFFGQLSEKLEKRYDKLTNRFIYSSYFLLFLIHILLLLKSLLFRGSFSIFQIYMIYYLILSAIVVISAVLYIPIVMNIRKLSHLSSSIQNEPENYIRYQTIFIACFKAPHVWALYYVYLRPFPPEYCLVICIIFDMVATPVLIQVSYLCCNKRNVQTLSRSFTIFSTNSSKVGPGTVNTDMTTSIAFHEELL